VTETPECFGRLVERYLDDDVREGGECPHRLRCAEESVRRCSS